MSALLSGIAVGFAVAMPVGPIGVLCIKRSLKDGFRFGLATGLGAATADASYGLLVALGLRSFFKPRAEAEITAPKGGLLAAWFSTFLLTLTNPMTVLAFIGLIAALGTASVAGPYLLVLGVFIGSLLWWLLLVGGVLLVKSRLPLHALRWLDAISGTVLVAWGFWIVFS